MKETIFTTSDWTDLLLVEDEARAELEAIEATMLSINYMEA